MSIDSEVSPHCHVIRIDQARILSLDQLQELERSIDQLVTSHPGRGILLDCAALQAVSSAFLGRLVQWKQKMDASGTELKLCELQPIVRQVFQMSRLDQRFAILPTRSAGLDSFAPTR
jgi:anti-anti-sigma factor